MDRHRRSRSVFDGRIENIQLVEVNAPAEAQNFLNSENRQGRACCVIKRIENFEESIARHAPAEARTRVTAFAGLYPIH